MAPEMLRGKGYGKGADYWSFGVMLFELMYGKLPYLEKGEGEDKKVMARIISQDPIELPPNDKYQVAGVGESKGFSRLAMRLKVPGISRVLNNRRLQVSNFW